MLFITKQKADISFVMKSGHLYLLLTVSNVIYNQTKSGHLYLLLTICCFGVDKGDKIGYV